MKRRETLTLARIALLCALAVALSALESIFTPVLPLGARAGLSNVVVMLAAVYMGLPATLAIVLFKVTFALLTRGAVSALLSLLGGLSSALLLLALFRYARPLGTLGISVLGAVTHSAAQLLGSCLLYGTGVLAYAPVLLALSLPSGAITATALRALEHFPLFQKINRKETKDEGSL